MAGNEEGRINGVFCVFQFKVMATKSIQVSGVNRLRPVLLSFIIVLCSQDTGEVLPLGAIIFVLLVEQFIGLFLVQLHQDYLDAREQVQFKKPLAFSEVQRPLKVRNISRSKIKAKLLEVHACGCCLSRRSETLALH